MVARWILSFLLIILTRNRDVDTHECTASESVACRQVILDWRQDKGRYYYASDNQTLVEMCRKQFIAVNCVNSFAKECLSEKEQAYFKKLVLGSDKFFNTFCFNDSSLRKRYLKHSSCIRNITHKLDDCTERYENSQKELDKLDENDINLLLRKTCCIYFENIRCSTNVTREVCGAEAAELISDLWNLLSGTYLTEKCLPYSAYDAQSCIASYSGCVRFVPNMTLLSTIFTFYVVVHILK